MAPMTIVFRIPAAGPEVVGFAYSPSLEAVLSLHVLAEPKHHPLQHPWVRSMQKLPPALKRDIETFSFAFRSYFPEFFFPSPTGELLDFAGELRRLREVDADLARLEFAIPLLAAEDGVDPVRSPEQLGAPAVRRILFDRAAAACGEDLAAMLVDDPAAFLDAFLSMLQRYWDEAFAQEWQRIEPDLAASVAEAGRLIAQRGLYSLLAVLRPEVRSDPAEGRFWLDRPHEHDVDVGPDQQLVLIPSTYVWPHIRVNCDGPYPLGLVFPASSILREARPRIPPSELVGVLRAVADDTRLRTLRLVAERPRSTQELAPLVGVTEAALSKHLRLLADAGLVDRCRQGYYVLYRLVPEKLAELGPSLEAFLVSD